MVQNTGVETIFLSPQCIMCHRPVTKQYAVYVDAKHFDILSQVHGTIDTQTFAQFIFGNGGYALIHNRCRLLWALAFTSAHLLPWVHFVDRDLFTERGIIL